MVQRIGLVDWAALGLASAGAIAFLIKLGIASTVADQQALAAQQQAQIASANVLGQVNNQLIRMLVETAARTGDPAMRGLLENNGIRFDVRPNGAGQAAPAASEVQP